MSHISVSYGVSPNSLRWRLFETGGHVFEDLVAEVLAQEVRAQDPKAVIHTTPVLEDRGCDIEITTDHVLEIAGITFYPPTARQHTIMVEVKTLSSGSGPRLSLERVGKNYHQLREHLYTHFVLITNASIGPRTARELAESFDAMGKNFVLIDEYLVWHLLERHKKTKKLPEREFIKPSEIVVESQISRIEHSEEVVYDIDLLIRNYTMSTQTITIENRSDLSWEASLPSATCSVPSNAFSAFRLKARRQIGSVVDLELRLYDHYGVEHPIRIEAQDIAFDFRPPLVGVKHHECLNRLSSILSDVDGPKLISVVGQAGTGKTRIIEEALEMGERPTRKVVRATFDRVQPKKAVKTVLRGLDRFIGKVIRRSGEYQVDDPISALRERLRNLDHTIYEVVILLEDLHHADGETCAFIRELPDMKRDGLCSLTVIISGRDDYSFPNDAYYALLDVLMARQKSPSIDESELTGKRTVAILRVPTFSPEDARDLIRAIIRNAPPFAVERIRDLGEDIPFYIVQSIEYMLETGIAILLSRQSVGIPNPETFASKIGFPKAHKEILSGRLDALNQVSDGSATRLFLELASFFGQFIPEELERVVLASVDADRAEDLLIGRRFLTRGGVGAFEWFHENILHLIQEQIDQEGRAPELALQIVNNPKLFKHFRGWSAGRILVIAGENEKAWSYYLSNIAEIAKSMNNFSSVNVDPACFDFVDYAVRSGLACDVTPTHLIRMLVLRTYIGVHNLSGWHGPRSADLALERLAEIPAKENERSIAKATFIQMRAHGLMDIGRLGASSRLLFELEVEIQQNGTESYPPELLFDLYNRLEDLYRMHNHFAVSEQYGCLAKKAAAKSGGELMTVSMFDNALIHHYLDTQRCIELHDEALAFAKDHGADRHLAHGEIGLLVIRLAIDRDNIVPLIELMERAQYLLQRGLELSYGALLSRIYHLIAILSYLLAEHGEVPWSRVERYTDLGLDAAIKYQAGLDIWMLYNTKAVAALRAGSARKEVRQYFFTALHFLRRSNFLFLGNQDLTFENIIVLSNIIRFFAEYGTERERLALALEIRSYEDDYIKGMEGGFTWARHRFDVMAQSVRQHGVIGQTQVPSSVLFDDKTGYALCITC